MNFDESLKLRKGIVQYKLDKSKAGKSSSTAGQPRPYAKKNMAIARLSAPQFVGHSFTVTPKQNFSTFMKQMTSMTILIGRKENNGRI